MPVYDYRCKQHGLFNDVQTLARHDAPSPCPECGVLCARVLVLPPMARQLAPAMRKAHEVNEKSQHAPLTTAAFRERQTQRQISGSQRCSCNHKPLGQRQSGLLYTPQGDKMFMNQRPWMISH